MKHIKELHDWVKDLHNLNTNVRLVIKIKEFEKMGNEFHIKNVASVMDRTFLMMQVQFKGLSIYKNDKEIQIDWIVTGDITTQDILDKLPVLSDENKKITAHIKAQIQCKDVNGDVLFTRTGFKKPIESKK